MKKLFEYRSLALGMLVVVAGLSSVSCESDELKDPSLQNIDNELDLTVSEESLELKELFIDNELIFNWSTGTNNGTNAAIRYTLELDLAGNDFSSPILSPVEDEKNRYSYSIDYGSLNQRLLDQGLNTGVAYDLEARLIAVVAGTSSNEQIAKTSFSLMAFKPVSSQLFLVGDATPNGLDIGNAIELIPSNSQRGVFTFRGRLIPGSFKFAVSRDDCLCQDFYTKDTNDDSVIVYNEGGSGDDLQWDITEEDNYKVRVDLLNKLISVSPVDDAPFTQIWIVGDATASGWNIDSPAAFTQDEDDSFIFTYEGNFNPGGFKIFAGPLGDWCGEWYRPMADAAALINGDVEQNSSCDPDNKWQITEETQGRYRIFLNTVDNSIQFEMVKLYMIGDAGPNGWNIATPEPMEYENGDFVFRGELGTGNPTGEFKISKFKGDWCDGEWINSAANGQSLSNTNFITTQACDGPDNKWKLQEDQAGTYEIKINLDAETMTINEN